jgi:hypothetical protein
MLTATTSRNWTRYMLKKKGRWDNQIYLSGMQVLHNRVGACITTNKRLLGSPLHGTNYTWEQRMIQTC